MATQLPANLPSIETVLHKERQVSAVDVEATDMQKNTNLKCPACLCFPLFPVMVAVPHSNCYHVFCKPCLEAAERNRVLGDEQQASSRQPLHKCPVCRTQYKKDQVTPVDRWSVPLRRQRDLVSINCPLKCSVKLTATSYLKHVNERCSIRMVKCPGRLINFWIL